MQNVSASSILPIAFAFHPHTFHEHCNLDSLSGGFSKGITGSILTSCTTSQESGHLPQGVLRLNWRELLFGEAERIMPHDADVVSINLGHIGCAEIAAAAASCCTADSNAYHRKGKTNCSLRTSSTTIGSAHTCKSYDRKRVGSTQESLGRVLTSPKPSICLRVRSRA